MSAEWSLPGSEMGAFSPFLSNRFMRNMSTGSLFPARQARSFDRPCRDTVVRRKKAYFSKSAICLKVFEK